MRILRFNNELTRWDTAARDEVERRTLDTKNYGLKFGPVSAEDSGTYLCLINNRREPDALLELTVEGEYILKNEIKNIYFLILFVLKMTSGKKNSVNTQTYG